LASIIPKKLHLIWVGDDRNRPDPWINSWRTNHPDWEFRLWGNAERELTPWRCAHQIRVLAAARRWDGVADIMRYEILREHGGVYVDADSLSVRPLDEWLLETPMFAVWESEEHAPGLVANGFIGAIAGHAALVEIVDRINQLKDPLRVREPWRLRAKRVAPWKTVGPVLFTEIVRAQPPDQVKILPSALFLPRHFLDVHEDPGKVVYARHFWQTTNKDRRLPTNA
jgi:mannosyltransferase OCH1-like enzyme